MPLLLISRDSDITLCFEREPDEAWQAETALAAGRSHNGGVPPLGSLPREKSHQVRRLSP